MRREKRRERFPAALRFRDRFDCNLRMQSSRAADHRKYQFCVIGFKQFGEHRAINFFLGARERQIGEPRARNRDVFLREIVDYAIGRRYELEFETKKAGVRTSTSWGQSFSFLCL